MKSFDIVLIIVAIVLVAVLLGLDSFSTEREISCGGALSFLIKVPLAIFLFLYIMSWKLAQYKHKMFPHFQKVLDYYDKVNIFFQKMLNSLNVRSIPLGSKLMLDPVHVFVIAFVLIFLIIL